LRCVNQRYILFIPYTQIETVATKKQAPEATHTPPPATPGSRSAARKSPAAKPAADAAPKVAAKAAPKDGKKVAKVESKLVRDSFTAPEADYALIDVLKQRALQAQRAAKKSELIRAGLRVLAGLSAKALVAQLNQLEAVKTGRPKKGH
jgi:hypothetical protein